MAQLLKKTTTNLIVRVCLLLTLLIILLWVLRADTLTYFFDENEQGNETLSAKSFSSPQNNCGHEEAFAFIPKATSCKWAQTKFLIVFGTLSVDNDGRRRRRALQRATCWTFPGVATRANAYNGSLLVLYAIARHPAHGFAFSESLRIEAEQWHDILNLPMDEGRVTTNKEIGGPGKWGNEAEIGMGKKVFFWLQLALRAFPLAVFVGKSDDDIFMNVPQYLADLSQIPRQRTYWGPYGGSMVLKNKEMELVDVKFMVGFCIALARDAAEAIVGYEPLRHIVSLPYTKERELDFRILNVDAEDVMIGRALKDTGFPTIFVAEQWGCRFHYPEDRLPFRNVSEHSVIVHHFKEHEYHTCMGYFIDKGTKIQNISINKESPTMYWVVCPIK